MMQLELWSVGKTNKDYIEDGIRLFSQRINHYCTFQLKILSAGKNSGKISEKELKKKEAEIINRQLTEKNTLISLDENGKSITSVGLSELIGQQQLTSRTLTFLIGGAYGIDQEILDKSYRVLSLSKLTFPHQLVRLIMAEQLYRAFSILNKEPYHHL